MTCDVGVKSELAEYYYISIFRNSLSNTEFTPFHFGGEKVPFHN